MSILEADMESGGDRRRELWSIVSLAVGAFLAIALTPVHITGPLGRVVGQVLWTYLGVGAVAVPGFCLLAGAIGFEWVRGLDFVRAGILSAGLIILIPYWVAVVTGVTHPSELPANHEMWSLQHQLVGVGPAFLAVGLHAMIGTAGLVIVGVLGVSLLTLTTIGWHPFRRPVLPMPRFGTQRVDQAVLELGAPEPVPAPARPAIADKGKRKRRELLPPDADREEEQAFIKGEAIPPFPVDVLESPSRETQAEDEAELDRMGQVLIDTLETFRVKATLGRHRSTGPVVTRFEVSPAPGVKVGRIAALADDLALKMEAKSIRIVAPIPGRPYVGVEVPNPTPRIVTLRELLAGPQWDPQRGGLPIALGRDLEGKPVSADLTKMPHLLIAGATGSGKSVCINTIITSLIYRYTERELQMLMIDPKMVELTAYNRLPHLIYPVVTANKHAAKALKWAMYEMEDRYELFSVNNVRNLHEFNRKVKEGKEVVMPAKEGEEGEDVEEVPGRKVTLVPYTGTTKPYIVVIVDELADLMMTVQGEVEKPLAILAQKARATGIHLLLATQRPSVNVITGLIKANFPSRIAFRVASKVDSRTILDQNGAESLLGNGDMLFLPPGMSEPVRVQGAFISTEETERVTRYYEEQIERIAEGREGQPLKREDIFALVQEREGRDDGGEGVVRPDSSDWDPLFRDAAELCISQQLGSTSLLQRRLRIGYGRAARIIDQLHDAGILGPPDGSKPREILISADELDDYCE